MLAEQCRPSKSLNVAGLESSSTTNATAARRLGAGCSATLILAGLRGAGLVAAMLLSGVAARLLRPLGVGQPSLLHALALASNSKLCDAA